MAAAAPRLSPSLRAPPPLRAVGGGTAPTNDDAVPEGHKGLHAALYGGTGGDAAAAAHAASAEYAPVAGEDDGAALIPVADYIAVRRARKQGGGCVWRVRG